MTASGSTPPLIRALRRLRRHLPWLAALTAYAGSRLFYAELGVVLDDRPLDYFWQYLDVEELRTNLLEAVFYQHTQPPSSTSTSAWAFGPRTRCSSSARSPSRSASACTSASTASRASSPFARGSRARPPSPSR
ncbi:MAG: hypothetical protein M5U28_01890 [Sandaracinaceae bacterium]|nr:hypothetical protein [Sandaracinaceae bacterium]